jgi:anti-anti-sigma factor
MAPTVAIEGRITINSSGEMRRKLLAAVHLRPAQVSVDLSQATYMDLSGLATLLEVVRIARSQGTRLVLTGVSGQPQCLFEIGELNRLFEFAPKETRA